MHSATEASPVLCATSPAMVSLARWFKVLYLLVHAASVGPGAKARSRRAGLWPSGHTHDKVARKSCWLGAG